MDQREASIVWTAFEEVAPNLCYIQRTREFLEVLMEEMGDIGQLSNRLEGGLSEIKNPSFRTDIKILGERLKRKQTPLKG
jgi:hypothetical protein